MNHRKITKNRRSLIPIASLSSVTVKIIHDPVSRLTFHVSLSLLAANSQQLQYYCKDTLFGIMTVGKRCAHLCASSFLCGFVANSFHRESPRLTEKHLFTRIILLALPILTAYMSSAQADTVSMSVPAAEKIFLQNNLVLLANRYNINISQALLQHAKAWDNPTLLTDQNLYDGKNFRHKTENGQSYGQVYIQLQQLVRTAGKIRKQTTLAQDNLASAESLFAETMRNLRYVLTTDMNTLGYLQAVAEVYNSKIESAKLLVKGMDAMLKAGDVSQKEDARIKALLFSLENEQAANLSQQIQLQENWPSCCTPAPIPRDKVRARVMISRLPGTPIMAT